MGPVLKHQTAAEDNRENFLLRTGKYNYNMNTHTHILGGDAKLSFKKKNFNYPA